MGNSWLRTHSMLAGTPEFVWLLFWCRRGGTYLSIFTLLISKVLFVWALSYQDSTRNPLQLSSECLKISHLHLVWFTSESSLGWLEGLFGPTPGFSCTCFLMKTVCHNFRYFKGFVFECLLWFLMLAQPQGHLSTLVLLLFTLPVKLYSSSWRTSSELIPHSYLLPLVSVVVTSLPLQSGCLWDKLWYWASFGSRNSLFSCHVVLAVTPHVAWKICKN